MGPIHPVWAPAAIHPLVECLLCNHAICQALASIVPCNHGPALDRAPCAQHGAGRAESFYPQIPFSSQPQFREPINQGCGKKCRQYDHTFLTWLISPLFGKIAPSDKLSPENNESLQDVWSREEPWLKTKKQVTR